MLFKIGRHAQPARIQPVHRFLQIRGASEHRRGSVHERDRELGIADKHAASMVEALHPRAFDIGFERRFLVEFGARQHQAFLSVEGDQDFVKLLFGVDPGAQDEFLQRFEKFFLAQDAVNRSLRDLLDPEPHQQLGLRWNQRHQGGVDHHRIGIRRLHQHLHRDKRRQYQPQYGK